MPVGKRYAFVMVCLASVLLIPFRAADGRVAPSTRSSSVGQNIVVNGDFEQPDIGTNLSGYAAGSSLAGWIVESGSIDLIGEYWLAAHGHQSVDLNGNEAGTLEQDLPTVPGQHYSLTFAMAGNPDAGPAIKQLEVWWGTVLVDTLTFDVTGHSRVSMGWGYHTYTLPATMSDTRLRFVSLTDGPNGPTLDDVTVRATGPAPLSSPLTQVIPLYPTGGAGLPPGTPVRFAWKPFPDAAGYVLHVWLVKQTGSARLRATTPVTLSTLVFGKIAYLWNDQGFLAGSYQYALLPLDLHGDALAPWSTPTPITIYNS